MRALLNERSQLEEDVRRLNVELTHSQLTERERMEMHEATKRECDLILEEARGQADNIRNTAEKEIVARIEALKRVEEVQRLVRVELRTLLGAMLEALETPSGVVRESLKNAQLVKDLQRITRAAVGATAVAVPDIAAESGVDLDEAVEEHVPATKRGD